MEEAQAKGRGEVNRAFVLMHQSRGKLFSPGGGAWDGGEGGREEGRKEGGRDM